MNRAASILSCVVILPIVGVSKKPSAFEVTDKLLDAIRQVESSGNRFAVSPCGARGPYQFMESTWKEFSKGESFDRAFEEEFSRGVCKVYLNWIDKYLERKMGKPVTRDMVICCYNGGVGRMVKAKFKIENMPRESREYVVKINKQITASSGTIR